MTSTRDRHYLDLDTGEAFLPENQHEKAKLAQAVDDYHFYSEGIKEMEDGKKAAAQTIIELSQLYGCDGVESGDTRFAIATTTSKRINKEKLLERGVSVDVIEYATDVSVSSEYVRAGKRPKGGK